MAAPEDIGADYHATYDHKTLFYDCFHTAENNYLELLGPPMLNLGPLVQGVSVNGKAVEVSEISRHKLDRLRVRRFDGDASEVSLSLDLGPLGVETMVPHARETAFNDRRVLLTMFRYEPAAWVADWARYHVAVHGADAVLIYANFVEPAVIRELCRELEGVKGLACFAVLTWDYPYGPVADTAFTSGVPRWSPRRWKSCFCQTGMFEHARLRFLGRARAVLNMDVDELAVTDSGASVFDLLEQSQAPVFMLREQQVGGTSEELFMPVTERRHRHFSRLLPPAKKPASKWVLAPGRLGEEAQWMTHQVLSAQAAEGAPTAWYAHFAPLNMGWSSGGRARLCSVANSPSSPSLRHAFEQAGWTKVSGGFSPPV